MGKFRKRDGIFLFLVLLVVSSLVVFTIAQQQVEFIIDGDRVYIDDPKMFISATPAVLKGSGWVVINFTIKNFSGDIDIALGYDNDLMQPNKVERYNPHLENLTSTYICDNSNPFFNFTTSPKHAWCYKNITLYDGGNNSIGSELELLFNHSFISGNTSARQIWWNETHTVFWTKVNKNFGTIAFNHSGMNTWKTATNVNINAGQEYVYRIFIKNNKDPFLQTKSKYSIVFKPSSQTLQQAKDSGNLFELDPWTLGLNEGLVAYYTLNESSGNVVKDATNNPRNMNGTRNNMDDVDWISGLIGNALRFKGNSDTNPRNFTSNSDANITQSHNRSVFAWVNRNVSGFGMGVISWGINANDREYTLTIETGRSVGVRFTNFDCTGGATNSFTDENWTLIGAVFNGTTHTLWINDTKVQTCDDADGLDTPDTPIVFGHRIATITWNFNGTMDEAAVWNRTLSDGEITDLYNDGVGITFTADATAPNVTINLPLNITYNGTIIDFNVTALDDLTAVTACNYTLNTGLDNITMTNVSTSPDQWNATNISVTSTNNPVSLTARFYCVDGTDNVNDTEEVTFFVNPISPNLTIDNPTGTLSLQTFNINITAQTFFNETTGVDLSFCYFNITDINSNPEVANTEIVNCVDTTATVSADGTYIINVQVNDTYDNRNFTNNSFVVDTSAPAGGGGGGGGGGGVTIISAAGDPLWSMTTQTGGGSYQFNVLVGASKTRTLVFENLGEESISITLSCEDVNGTLCQYVTFEEGTFTLPLTKEIKISKKFTVKIPDGTTSQDGVINLVGTDNEQRRGIITSTVGVKVTGIFVKLTSSRNVFGLSVPYWVLYLFLGIPLLSILSFFIVTKRILDKRGLAVSSSILIGFVLSTGLLFLPFV